LANRAILESGPSLYHERGLMRLLFLSSVHPSPLAPYLGSFNRSRVEALRAFGEVQVLAPVAWTRVIAARRGQPPGPKTLPNMGGGPQALHPTYFYPPGILRSAYGWFMWQSVRRPVGRVLRAFRPEAVLSYWAHPDGEAGLRAARQAGVPAGLIVGGTDVLLLTRDPGRRRAIARVLQGVDAVFPVGSGLRAKVLELGVAENRVHELQQGVDPERFSSGDPAAAKERLGAEVGLPLLLFVGNLVPVKAAGVLLESAGILAARGQPFQLWLVGDGPQRDSLRAQATAQGLAGRIRFLGAQAHERMPDFFRAADLTVLCSHSEGIPNVLRESLACGTPFVATRVGGIADIATPECILVPPGDPAALAEAIAHRLASPVAKRAVAPYTWRDTARTIHDVLSRLANHPSG
jgi:glycosyltransferase involved in cell wall biosynthesis